MTRYICIHGHFYQPPRENPWLEDVELQDSAYPYHDWNHRITDECYRQNAASRILNSDKEIVDIVNNYSRISFDFGPTLLSWLQKYEPDVYQSILQADKESQKYFDGHGAAIAQAYNHIIMPLANVHDKHTQVIWGIDDFVQRFERKPEGMWLPETAVDIESLEVLADHGISFTILAPHQAAGICKIDSDKWEQVTADNLNTTIPYLCRLPSGKKINLFFYNGALSRDVAYGSVLERGDMFAENLVGTLNGNNQENMLAHIATDGETYGHHHRHADMALAYCLRYIEEKGLAKPTIYGQYLEKFPPAWEVEIAENTSWSCPHGIERWRDNCGCHYGRLPAKKQQFRQPLRLALDWLRDKLSTVYQTSMNEYFNDPWKVRDEYISLVNDRSLLNVENFLSSTVQKKKRLSLNEKVKMLKLLEMQRNALLMYTSCGWFFDDICGIETLQILQYAARAIQLAKEINGQNFEAEFMEILQKSPVNADQYETGKQVYQQLVKSSNIDLNRVGAHLAVSSIFNEKQKQFVTDIYCYMANIESYKRLEAGIQKLATGRAEIQSRVVLENHLVDFAVLHLGSHNLICAVTDRMPDDQFFDMQQSLENAFRQGNTTEVMRLMNVSFGQNSYSLWHLFKDEQRRILYELLETTWQEIEASFRHIYEQNYPVIEMMRGMNMPLPKGLSSPAEFILNQELSKLMRNKENDLDRIRALVNEATRLSLNLDETTLGFEATAKINRLMDMLAGSPNNLELLQKIKNNLHVFFEINARLDLQKAQNIFFDLSRKKYPIMLKKAKAKNKSAKQWIDYVKDIAHYLSVKLP
jgi:alpha-amylase/alpha-mannosidase (GH57 family)